MHETAASLVIAGSTLLLLFTGIHNAWDTVSYIAVDHVRRDEPASLPEARR